ncbi:YciI family protein [Myxococcaceae bacterium JPH2]|nr:YciI family protein [Myxococcaceae bacterium JPH2]
MKVMLMVKTTPQGDAGQQPPSEEALVAMHNFNEEMRKAGVLLDLGGLTPMNRGARLRFSKRQCKVMDGPFAESKELIAGYSLIEVKTFAEAIAWAKRAPFGVLLQEGQEVEVDLRPLFDPAEFDVPGEAEERAQRLSERPAKA